MIKKRIASGEFNLDLFINIMKHDGYITEIDAPEGAGMCSSDMEKTHLLQEEFNFIFSFFYPNIIQDIEFGCVATSKGFKIESGGYSYALYNRSVISREEVEKILIKENQLSGE